MSGYKGIGRAIAEALATSGADVALIDLSVSNLEETHATCANFGVRVGKYACDVTDGVRVKAVFESIKQDLGFVEQVALYFH